MKASDRSTFLRNVVAAAGASASVLIAGAALAGSVTYTYDTLGRVIRAAYSSGVVIVYTYDAAGNRTSVVTSGAP